MPRHIRCLVLVYLYKFFHQLFLWLSLCRPPIVLLALSACHWWVIKASTTTMTLETQMSGTWQQLWKLNRQSTHNSHCSNTLTKFGILMYIIALFSNYVVKGTCCLVKRFKSDSKFEMNQRLKWTKDWNEPKFKNEPKSEMNKHLKWTKVWNELKSEMDKTLEWPIFWNNLIGLRLNVEPLLPYPVHVRIKRNIVIVQLQYFPFIYLNKIFFGVPLQSLPYHHHHRRIHGKRNV